MVDTVAVVKEVLTRRESSLACYVHWITNFAYTWGVDARAGSILCKYLFTFNQFNSLSLATRSFFSTLLQSDLYSFVRIHVVHEFIFSFSHIYELRSSPSQAGIGRSA